MPDFDIQFVRIGGLNRVGLASRFARMAQLPGAALRLRGTCCASFVRKRFSAWAAIVSGPVMLAAALAGIPLVVMEPNSVPGFANRKMAGRVYRALLGFENTRRWFPADRAEVTGLPVRPEFFALHHKPSDRFTSFDYRRKPGRSTLNRASKESWPYFRSSQMPSAYCSPNRHGASMKRWPASLRFAGVAGEVVPFIKDMAEAFLKRGYGGGPRRRRWSERNCGGGEWPLS